MEQDSVTIMGGDYKKKLSIVLPIQQSLSINYEWLAFCEKDLVNSFCPSNGMTNFKHKYLNVWKWTNAP